MSTPDNEHNLMLQAVATAETYFEKAVRIIDAQFGEGYAKANPAVLAAFMGACSALASSASISVRGMFIVHSLPLGVRCEANITNVMVNRQYKCNISRQIFLPSVAGASKTTDFDVTFGFDFVVCDAQPLQIFRGVLAASA